GIEDGDLEDLAVGAFYEKAVTALKFGLNLAEGCLLGGRIEDKVALAGLRGDDIVKFGGVVALGNLDGGDGVIAHDGWRIGIDDATPAVDEHDVTVDADGGEHCGEQGSLVLAIAVAAAEDVCGEMRLGAADADFNGDVADVPLDEAADGLGLVKEVRLAGGELCGLCGDIR